jgi:hypothetical protein
MSYMIPCRFTPFILVHIRSNDNDRTGLKRSPSYPRRLIE